MIFFMLTNIVAESSELLCAGNGAREKMISAFDLKGNPEMIELKGVVSRKKQLVPTLVSALQRRRSKKWENKYGKPGIWYIHSRAVMVSTADKSGKEQYSDDRWDGHDLH